MENVKCKMENAEWRMQNEKWRMENVKWRMQNGEWRMQNGKCEGGVRVLSCSKNKPYKSLTICLYLHNYFVISPGASLTRSAPTESPRSGMKQG